MATRKIIEAEVAPPGRYYGVTFITLDCGHQRSLGGHMLNNQVFLPSELLGRSYECKDSHCLRF